MGDLTKLGRYKLGKVLGRGAMGVVYEGLDPSLNRRVAIKTILKNAAIDTETAQMYSAQFAREAQAAGRLNHPNIVQVHDFAEEGEIAYLVMEYIQGRELRSFFDAKELFEPPEAVRIMCELLDALDFAHEAGVIHRDVKPANVMLDAQRRVKLADFGVARIQDSERSAAGTMVGTPAFMSPEQISGGKIDRRTDVFSAGVVFYQMLTGEQPFTGAGAWTVAKKIMQDDPPPASSVARSVSPVFDGIVNKALAKKQADRFTSAKEFAAALRGALAGDPQATVLGPAALARPKAAAAPKASDAEVEFWRAIQNSTDATEIEFYLEQFPDGTYAQLARHKIAKLREPAGAARGDAEQTLRLEAEARARQQAQALAAQQAEEQARREAETRARLEAEQKAKQDAAERAKRVAADKAQRDAQEKARQAAALAKLPQQREEAARAAATDTDPDATVAIGRPAAPTARAPVAQKKSFLVPAIVGAVVIVVGVAVFVAMSRKPAPAPAAAPASIPVKPATPAVDEEKIRRDIEERVRREYADKSAAEQSAAKVAGEKAIAEKILAAKTEKAAADKAVAEKAAADKIMADKLAAAKSSGEKAALEKAAADKAAADKAAADKLAAEKAATDKAAADKAAADKAATEKIAAAKAAAPSRPGLPAVGDRWVYEAREFNGPKRATLTIEARAVNGNAVTEYVQRSDGDATELTQRPVLAVSSTASGIVNFPPYLRAFQELRDGQKLGDIDFQRLYRCSETMLRCSVFGKVVGREKVTVKAGTFDTTKVVLEFNLNAFGRGTTIEYRFWYADAVNRYVKHEMRSDNSAVPYPQLDVELVSFTHAGAR